MLQLLLLNLARSDANRRLDFEEFKTAMPLLNVSDDGEDGDPWRADNDTHADPHCAVYAFSTPRTSAVTRILLPLPPFLLPLQLPASVNVERLFHDLDDNGSGVVRQARAAPQPPLAPHASLVPPLRYEEFCEWLESTKRSNFEIVARHSSHSGPHPDPKLRYVSVCLCVSV